jgi:hypothetical protein
MLTPAEELLFWTGIMRDHGEFLVTALSSRERETVQGAENFRNIFIGFRNEAQALVGTNNITLALELATRVRPELINFINFKRQILRRLLQCNIEINFPPAFINHMINEANEFLRTIDRILNPNLAIDMVNAAQENLRLHRIWLPDGAGHAASVISTLDPNEATLIEEAKTFKASFEQLFLKAIELSQMLPRASLMDGNLNRFNQDVAILLTEFVRYLRRLRELRGQCTVLGTLKPLMADHMIREENYYLNNIQDYKQILVTTV